MTFGVVADAVVLVVDRVVDLIESVDTVLVVFVFVFVFVVIVVSVGVVASVFSPVVVVRSSLLSFFPLLYSFMN